jgi:hypothetical protein
MENLLNCQFVWLHTLQTRLLSRPPPFAKPAPAAAAAAAQPHRQSPMLAAAYLVTFSLLSFPFLSFLLD